MLNKIVFKSFSVIVFLFLLAGCPSHSKSVSSDFSLMIVSPEYGWTYNEASQIMFFSNLIADDVEWYSSKDGFLGRGCPLYAKLSAGNHVITLKDPFEGKSVTVSIFVSDLKGDDYLNLITSFPFEVPKPFSSQTGIVSIGGSAENVHLELDYVTPSEPKENLSLKVFSLNPDVLSLKPCKRSFSRSAVEESECLKRKFYVLNTSEGSSECHEINATRYYKGELISVYFPDDYSKDTALIDEIIESLETSVIKRVNALWGSCADINGDKTLAILFTPTINNEKTAVGFFHSSDFFMNNRNAKPADYNPYSNEMDIIYVAVPDENYTKETILATVAHEYAHAINFTSKTFSRIGNGSTKVSQEETFLNEGWSHLTENLCGYGISGAMKNLSIITLKTCRVIIFAGMIIMEKVIPLVQEVR